VECSQVTDLLSEYMDDVLDPLLKSEVEGHLSICGDCTEALNELQSALEAVRSLPPVQAPPDFLDAVHERIDENSFFRRVLNKLFRPPRIKLPIELAGVLASVFLIVFLYYGLETEVMRQGTAPEPPLTGRLHFEEYKSLPLSKGSEDATRKPEPQPFGGLSGKPEVRSASPEMAGTRAAPPVAAKARTIRLALLVKPFGPEIDTLREPKGKASPASKSRERERVADAAASRKAALGETGKAPAELEQAAEEQPAAASASKPQEREDLQDAADALAAIRELVKQARGTVLEVKYRQDPRKPESVLIQVPARSYPFLMEHLRRSARLKEDSEGTPRVPEHEQIRLHITFTPGE